jgi:hypothetical protein
MSIIDQARTEAEDQMDEQREHVGLLLVCEQRRYVEGFAAGVQWLLDQLTDPDQATVDDVARALAARRPDLDVDESYEVTEPCKTRIRESARTRLVTDWKEDTK